MGLGLLGMGNRNTLLIVLVFAGPLLHTLNHSLFKALLFFTAGSVYQQTQIPDMEKLGGLIPRMPQKAILFLVGGMAIGGLPPLNGFVSEFLLYSGILPGIKFIGITYIALMIFWLAELSLIGSISMLTITKIFGTTFLSNPGTQLHHQPREVSLGTRLQQYIILIIILSTYLFPQLYFSVFNKIVLEFIRTDSSENILIPGSLLNSISAIGKFAILFILLLILIYFIRKGFSRKRPVGTDSTWGCGYAVPTLRMQYTGKSFSNSLGKLPNFVVLKKRNIKKFRVMEYFRKKESIHLITMTFLKQRFLTVLLTGFLTL